MWKLYKVRFIQNQTHLNMGDLMYDSPLEHVVTLVTDLFLFFINSIYYWCETLWLTILPDRYRQPKVIEISAAYPQWETLFNNYLSSVNEPFTNICKECATIHTKDYHRVSHKWNVCFDIY